MPKNKFLLAVPLLDPTQQVIGYKIVWQRGATGDESADRLSLHQMLALTKELSQAFDSGCLFLDARPPALASGLQRGASQNLVLTLSRSDVSAAMSLREQGFDLALRDVDLAFLVSDHPMLSLVKYVVLTCDDPELAAIKIFVSQTKRHYALLAEGIVDWRGFDACAALGLNGFFGNYCAGPRASSQTGTLGPQAVLILQLMQMIHESADERQLEKALKRDATLSYKLLRHINSASFGVEVQIQSLRHAVALLGYSALYRWLALLLAMTHTEGFSPGLLQAAIVRGRFAELLGQGLLSKNEAENLFIVGMFSLLDQLLGISIHQVLRHITLPEAVVQALVSREGIYGPFLALAEACERDGSCAHDIADALFMTATQVNRAHLSALAWAWDLKT